MGVPGGQLRLPSEGWDGCRPPRVGDERCWFGMEQSRCHHTPTPTTNRAGWRSGGVAIHLPAHGCRTNPRIAKRFTIRSVADRDIV